MAQRIKRSEVPGGLFSGDNMMTPVVVAHYKLSGRRYAEVSTPHSGRGMSGGFVHGVTIRPDPQKQSTLIHGRLADAERYLDSINDDRDPLDSINDDRDPLDA